MIHYLVLRVQDILKNPVTIAKRIHPFPSRTRKLSSLTSMILGGRPPGKVDSCRNQESEAIRILGLYSSLAQLAEHAAVNRVVAGSSPARGAKQRKHPNGCFFVLLFILCSNHRQLGQPRSGVNWNEHGRCLRQMQGGWRTAAGTCYYDVSSAQMTNFVYFLGGNDLFLFSNMVQ